MARREVDIYKKRHDELVARQERMRDLLFAASNEQARILVESLMWTKPSIADLALSLLLQSCFQCWSCGSTRAVRAFDTALVCSQCGERYILFPMLALPQCGECGGYYALPKKTGGWACMECGTDIPQSEVKLHLEIERKSDREKRFFVITAKINKKIKG